MKKLVPYFILLTILLIALYWQGLSAPYFSVDDRALIEIPQITTGLNWTSVKTIFTPNTHIDYYPLRDLSYIIDKTLWPNSLFVARIHQLIYFSISATVLLLIALELGISFFWASSISFLWAIHPYHAESILWLSGRKDVMALCFALLSSFFFIKELKTSRGVFLGTTFFIASLFCKASFILLPFIPLSAFIFKIDLLKKRKILVISLLCAFIACLYSLGQTWFYSSINPMQKIISMHERVISSLVAFGRMIWGWFNPYANIVDIENLPPWSQYHLHLLPFTLCVLILIGVGTYLIIKHKKKNFLLLPTSFILLYLPISGLIFPHQNFYSTRYFEPASLILWISLMLLLNQKKQEKWHSIFIAALIIFFSFLSFKESSTWASSLAVRKKAFQEVPESLALKAQYFEELINATRSKEENDKYYVEKNTLANELEEACSQKELNELNECKTFYYTAYYVNRYNGRFPEAQKYLKLYQKALSPLTPLPFSLFRLEIEQKLSDDTINDNDILSWEQQRPTPVNPEFRLIDITFECLKGHPQSAQKLYSDYMAKNLLNEKERDQFSNETLSPSITQKLSSCIKN